ncbi:MAG: prepilin peptidase [Lachnospiraceae bacterium]|nr:prepilin peptidase [Lachnospiraceae bacterium]
MPLTYNILFTIIIFLYGIVVGSFLNVLIYRIPKHENIATKRSHCMECGYQLKWYDLIPLFSYLFLRGRCRKCGARISVQYPVIEAVNGILWVLTFLKYGLSIETLLYCLLFSALLALSVIDFRTYEIPVGFNIFILVLGVVRVATDYRNWLQYLIGLVSVSLFLFAIFAISKGRGIGGGDVKLMAVTGLLLGWKLNLLGFVIGCILGSVIHIIRMRVSKEGRTLAMGPYLSLGVAISVFFGDFIVNWYMSFFTA